MSHLYEVEAVEPRKPRARKSLVRRWVVLADSPEQAIQRAIDEQIAAILGPNISEATRHSAEQVQRGDTWNAIAVEGCVIGRPSVLR